MPQQDLSEWDEDLVVSVDQEYIALLRSIRWAKGFGLLFVQCSPAEGKRLIERIQGDVGGKRFNQLMLDGSVTDLYELLQSRPEVPQSDVLFLTGLEKSLIEYMEPGPQRTYTAQDFYAEDRIPRLLGQLNLQREILKETYPLCFVFLVPRYVVKYLVRKAPDFFDWRAGVWEFVSPQEEIEKQSQQILQGEYEQYLDWSSTQRRKRIFEIEDLVSESNFADNEIISLRIEQGNLCVADERYKEAFESFDAALATKPDDHTALYNKGLSLNNLGYYEAAIASYDAALAIKPNDYIALNNKGNSLSHLGRYEAAIASYDAALAIKPDDYVVLNNKGSSLHNLGRYEDAIHFYDAALALKSDLHEALNNKSCAYALLNKPDEALKYLKKAIELAPERYIELAKADTDFDSLRNDPRFQALIQSLSQNS
ncbi:MAG: tetratricopeptide repeat protein [Cyanobacteria bacterium P01_D01_bin.156]